MFAKYVVYYWFSTDTYGTPHRGEAWAAGAAARREQRALLASSFSGKVARNVLGAANKNLTHLASTEAAPQSAAPPAAPAGVYLSMDRARALIEEAIGLFASQS